MKCRRCNARNAPDSVTCWACGVRLRSSGLGRHLPVSFRPEAMRYYHSSSAAVGRHQAWLDGLVLVSTILFGLLLAYFVVEVLPGSISQARESPPSFLNLRSPLSFLAAPPRALPLAPLGAAQEHRGVVAQVVEPRRSPSEGGRQAGAGREFLTVTVVIDNQATQPLPYSLQDWKVRDSRGRTGNAQPIQGAGWLSSGTVEPSQRVQGTVSFLVPQGEAHPQISFSPSRLGAVMRWDASTPPAP